MTHGVGSPAQLAVPRRNPAPRRRIVALTCLALLVAGVALWARAAGTFLIDADPPAQADAIVVLAGNSARRLPHGQTLLSAGYAPLIVVSNEHVFTHGVRTTWLDLHTAGIAAPDLPDDRLLVLDNPPPESTVDEAHRVAALLAERGAHSALLVTDAFHSRRAYLLFRAAFAHRGLSVRSVPADDALDLEHWWTHPRSARTVAEEWTKLGVYLVRGDLW
ncbi:MAG: hypothetical protein NVSMB2_04760 [Chloroflexota bacterium]